MKFCVDITHRIGTCLTIQSYSPGGAAFPDCFACFSNPVAVTAVWHYPSCRVARSVQLRYYQTFLLVQLIRSTQLVGLLFGYF